MMIATLQFVIFCVWLLPVVTASKHLIVAGVGVGLLLGGVFVLFRSLRNNKSASSFDDNNDDDDDKRHRATLEQQHYEALLLEQFTLRTGKSIEVAQSVLQHYNWDLKVRASRRCCRSL
jgi:hypothetical protein